MRKKEVEIDYEEGEGLEKVIFKGTVVLKRLSWGEKNATEDEASTIQLVGKTPIAKISPARLKVAGLSKAIISNNLKKTIFVENAQKEMISSDAPYMLDPAGLLDPTFPQDIGDKLFEAFTELNEMEDKKKEDSEIKLTVSP